MVVRIASGPWKLPAGLRAFAAAGPIDSYAPGAQVQSDEARMRQLALRPQRPEPGAVLARMEKDAPVHQLMAETGMRALDQLAVDNEGARVALIGARVATSSHFQAAVCKQGLQALEQGQDTDVGMARRLLDDKGFFYSREGKAAMFAILSYLHQESGPEAAALLDRTLDLLDGRLSGEPLAAQELVAGTLDEVQVLRADREQVSRVRDALVAPVGSALGESGERLIVGGVAVKIRRPS